MTLSDIAYLRLVNQQVASGRYTSAKALAEWMGALQAQDFQAVKWAMGLRIPGSTISTIEKAIDDGEIIRSHLLRPTWHFVSRDDFLWILELSAPKIMPSLKYRQDFLGLSPAMLRDTNAIISEILKGKHLDREPISAELKKAGIDIGENRISHILLWAEMSGIICSGRSAGSRQTYALISERVPGKSSLKKEEVPGALAKKYFKSHGPATTKDFGWWSGLSAKEIRTGLEQAAPDLESTEADSVTYWFGKDLSALEVQNSAYMLPPFDEFIISYSDRSAVLSGGNHKKAVSQNGIFKPVLILKNQVSGLWKAVRTKDALRVEIELFKSLKKAEKAAVERAAATYGNFLGKNIDLKYS